MLVIDCCIREEESYTRKYYEAYLDKFADGDVKIVKLAELSLQPLNRQLLTKRDELCEAGDFENDFFRLVRQFQSADEILIAAPYWDLAFPALLKVYLEWITVNGLTFGYGADGSCIGKCRAERLLYFSSCGGYTGGKNLGFEYVKELAAMLGIPRSFAYTIEGMDIDPSRRDVLLKEASDRLNKPEI